jgi:hypothetical protein
MQSSKILRSVVASRQLPKETASLYYILLFYKVKFKKLFPRWEECSLCHSQSHTWVENWTPQACTYNATLRCVCLTVVAMEKQYVLHILSVCL